MTAATATGNVSDRFTPEKVDKTENYADCIDFIGVLIERNKTKIKFYCSFVRYSGFLRIYCHFDAQTAFFTTKKRRTTKFFLAEAAEGAEILFLDSLRTLRPLRKKKLLQNEICEKSRT